MDELLSLSLSLASDEERDRADDAVLDDEEGSEKALRQWNKKHERLNRPVKRRKAVQQQRAQQRSAAALSAATAQQQPQQQPFVAKEARAGLFAEWLLRHFGERLLRGDEVAEAESTATALGTRVAEWTARSAHSLFIFPALLDPSARHQPSRVGVVDVAGGKGHLAYLLSTLYHIPTAVVEPRPLNLARYQAQYQHRRQYMLERQANGTARPGYTVPPSDGCHLMTHFRCYFPASTPVAHVPHLDTSSSPLYVSPSPLPPPPARSDVCAQQQPVVHSFVDPSLSSSLSVDCPAVSLLHSYLSRATLLVGLHADGATEAIVDFALRHGKRFAVVPCCVFQYGSEDETSGGGAEGERAKEGRRVRSYEGFVAHLLAKDERIRQHTLPFQGRNLCLYMDAAR